MRYFTTFTGRCVVHRNPYSKLYEVWKRLISSRPCWKFWYVYCLSKVCSAVACQSKRELPDCPIKILPSSTYDKSCTCRYLNFLFMFAFDWRLATRARCDALAGPRLIVSALNAGKLMRFLALIVICFDSTTSFKSVCCWNVLRGTCCF